jgi:hypothetical protein
MCEDVPPMIAAVFIQPTYDVLETDSNFKNISLSFTDTTDKLISFDFDDSTDTTINYVFLKEI